MSKKKKKDKKHKKKHKHKKKKHKKKHKSTGTYQVLTTSVAKKAKTTEVMPDFLTEQEAHDKFYQETGRWPTHEELKVAQYGSWWSEK